MEAAAKHCRDNIRKAKAENELRLARDPKSNKKICKWQRKETVAHLLNGDGTIMTDNKEKAEVP